MMYEALAAFYDALVKDGEATKRWVDFVNAHHKGKKLLEVACGSGEITLALAAAGYDVSALDLSRNMLRRAQDKAGSEHITWRHGDMRDLSSWPLFDGILCFCDSLNYLLNKADVHTFFVQAYTHLHASGVLLFDMHSQDRLSEFEEEYCEAGMVHGTPYEWTIQTQEDRIYHNFAFYDADARVTLEQHIQRVYDPKWIQSELEQLGFQVSVYTDFTQKGIHSGEKYFYVAIKQEKEQ